MRRQILTYGKRCCGCSQRISEEQEEWMRTSFDNEDAFIHLSCQSEYVRPQPWVVFFHSQELWWRAGGNYTPNLLLAGAYTREEAERRARCRSPQDDGRHEDEAMPLGIAWKLAFGGRSMVGTVALEMIEGWRP